MSTRNVELIHERLKEELDRLALKPAAAARAAGEPDSQGLRDVLGGRKRLSTDLLAALGAAAGVDVLYVLTGQRGMAPGPVLTREEAALVDNFRNSPPDVRAAIKTTSALGAQSSLSKKKSA